MILENEKQFNGKKTDKQKLFIIHVLVYFLFFPAGKQLSVEVLVILPKSTGSC